MLGAKADDLKVMKEVARRSELFVAGGITPATMSQYIRLGADVAIVGSGIRHAADPVKAAEELARLARQDTKEQEQ